MLAPENLIAKFDQKGMPRFRALQVLHAVCKKGKRHYESITTLSKELQKTLEREAPLFRLKPVRKVISADHSTAKVLFELNDGLKIEGVLMRFKDGRHTVCISSQAGCQLGCKFCATGTLKFGRNLSYEEIADQVLYFAQELQQKGQHISNVVYMGMGEPFMNYENVIKSVRAINAKEGLNIRARGITISTAGICEGIEKLTEENIQVNLAVSLHAPNQELRQKIMPIARKYTLAQLIQAVKAYLQKTGRRVSYEYVMLNGINDGRKEALELAGLLGGQLCHVNLIPYNATGIAGIKGSLRKTIAAFKSVLASARIPVTIRLSLGQDIAAACGQLANAQ